MAKAKNKVILISAVLASALIGCGGFVYTTVGGNVKGLTSGSLLVLKNEGNYTERLIADGPFSFRVASNGSYAITVGSQPNTDYCTVINGSGQMAGDAPVNNIAVNCVPNVPVAGTLTGLVASTSLTMGTKTGASVGAPIDSTALILDQGAIAKNGAFTLPYYIVNGYKYSVVVAVQPAAQVCTVLNGDGVADNTNLPAATKVAVNCVAGVPIAGTVTGLGSGLSLVLLNNGGDALGRTALGAFTFPSSLLNGSTYSVTVGTQPTGQTCTVTNGSGTAVLATPSTASNIAVNCVNN